MVNINPLPQAYELPRLYTTDYWIIAGKLKSRLVELINIQTNKRRWRNVLDNRAGRKLFEVGCRGGFLVTCFVPTWELFELEPGDNGIELVNNTHKIRLLKISPCEGQTLTVNPLKW